MAKTYIEDIKLNAVRNKIFASLSSAPQVNLFNVITLSSGDYLPTQKMIDGRYNVYGGGGTTDKKHNTFNVEFETFGIGRVGARCGCVFKIKPQSWVTDNALYASNIDKKFDLEFLIHFLNFKNFNQYANTSAQPVISLKRISVVSIPNIDLMLQKEIVVILNNVESGIIEIKNDKYGIRETLNFISSKEILDDELINQLSLVKKLGQQLLQDAVQGKLVGQNKKDEPASELFKKIKAEKEKLIAEKKLKKEKELSPIKPEEIPFEIPGNWVWCRLGDLCIELLGGYAFDSTRYSKTETQNQVIRLGNVKPNQLVLETTPVFINDDYAKEALRASLYEGDILITMTGTRAKKDYLFSLCLTESDLQTKNLFLNQRVGCFRFGLFIDNNYINIALKDVRLLNAVFESSTGAANQANIGIAALKDILIPLPPLAEKKRIVKKLDELMQYCNELEASIKQSESQNEKLLQQVLREALRKEPVGV